MNDFFLTNFSWLSLGMILFIFVIMLYLEIRRVPAKNLIWRCLALSVALVSLSAMIWEPQRLKTTTNDIVILKGEGTSEAVMDSLKQKYPLAETIATDSLHQWYGGGNIILTGDGLPYFDQWKVSGAKVTYLPGEKPGGITSLRHTHTLSRGDSLIAEGVYSGELPASITLSLDQAVLDSVTVREDGTFRLQTIANLSGHLIYTLAADSLYTENLPVHVREMNAPVIAMVTSFPTFELRTLKEYLATLGSELYVRQQISRDRFSYEFLNTEDQQGLSLTEEWLRAADLLITDQGQIESYPRREFEAISQAVYQGMGLLILPEDMEAGRGNLRPGTLSESDADGNEKQFYLKGEADVIGLHSENGRLVAGYRRTGKGRTGVSLKRATYPLILSGDTSSYQHYWSVVISSMLRDKSPAAEFLQWPPVVDEPIEIRTYSAAIPEVSWSGYTLPVKEELYGQNSWLTTVWPEKTGWHELVVNQDTTYVYVHDNREWRPLRRARQQNLRYSQKNSGISRNIQKKSAVSSWWAYGAFLFSVSFLWIERKNST